jgi:TPR repeat protein
LFTIGTKTVGYDPMQHPQPRHFTIPVQFDVNDVLITPDPSFKYATATVFCDENILPHGALPSTLATKLFPPPVPVPSGSASVSAPLDHAKNVYGNDHDDVEAAEHGEPHELDADASSSDEEDLGTSAESANGNSRDSHNRAQRTGVHEQETKHAEPQQAPPKERHSYIMSNLPVGDTKLQVTVEAQDGTKKHYFIIVTRMRWNPEGYEADWNSVTWDVPGARLIWHEPLGAGGAENAHRSKYLWYLTGAKANYPEAQYNLALMYAGDHGHVEVPVDEENMLENANAREAAESPDLPPVTPRAIERKNEGKWQRLGDDKSQLHHFKWLLTAAENGYKYAQYRLGLMFLRNKVNPEWFENVDDGAWDSGMLRTEAIRWFKAAAEQDDGPSCYQLGIMFADGVGVKANLKTALKFFEESGQAEAYFIEQLTLAESGDRQAAYRVGQMYLDGIGTEMDHEQALLWYERSGEPTVKAKNIIRAKYAALRPHYARLFEAYDLDQDGEIDKKDFEGFYRDTLLAKGYELNYANEHTVSTYQGKQRSDVMFNAYDHDRNHKISFKEIWGHPHTHTQLLPSNAKQLTAAVMFFRTWNLDRGYTKSPFQNKTLNKMASRRALTSDSLHNLTRVESTDSWQFEAGHDDNGDDLGSDYGSQNYNMHHGAELLDGSPRGDGGSAAAAAAAAAAHSSPTSRSRRTKRSTLRAPSRRGMPSFRRKNSAHGDSPADASYSHQHQQHRRPSSSSNGGSSQYDDFDEFDDALAQADMVEQPVPSSRSTRRLTRRQLPASGYGDTQEFASGPPARSKRNTLSSLSQPKKRHTHMPRDSPFALRNMVPTKTPRGRVRNMPAHAMPEEEQFFPDPYDEYPAAAQSGRSSMRLPAARRRTGYRP